MKTTALILWVCATSVFYAPEVRAEDWIELKSEHFIIMAHDASVPSEDILYAAEKYYQRIASDLGYPRTSNFWTWANRVKIFIYADKASYLKGSGQPEWSEGAADYTAKQIISYQGSPRIDPAP
jgi:hypothetical protein